MFVFDRNFKIKSKLEFIEFLEILKNDKSSNANEWENKSIEEYLDGVKSWVEDMDGYYDNMHESVPSNINWEFIALLFYVGKIYE